MHQMTQPAEVRTTAEPQFPVSLIERTITANSMATIAKPRQSGPELPCLASGFVMMCLVRILPGLQWVLAYICNPNASRSICLQLELSDGPSQHEPGQAQSDSQSNSPKAVLCVYMAVERCRFEHRIVAQGLYC